MDIKVLGTGCPKCKTLEKITRETCGTNGYKCRDIEGRRYHENNGIRNHAYTRIGYRRKSSIKRQIALIRRIKKIIDNLISHT